MRFEGFYLARTKIEGLGFRIWGSGFERFYVAKTNLKVWKFTALGSMLSPDTHEMTRIDLYRRQSRYKLNDVK